MVQNHGLVWSLIDGSSETLSGWDDKLGNYTQKYLNRYLLVENVVRECARLCSESDHQDGELHARNLLNHFKISDNDEK